MPWAQTVFEAVPLLPLLPSSSHANQGSVPPPLPALCPGKAGAGRPLLEVTQVQVATVLTSDLPGARWRQLPSLVGAGQGVGGWVGLRGSSSASHLSQHPWTRSDIGAQAQGRSPS